ncbi:MAG TPA: N-acetyltransferase [Bdellovibrionota bacterium]|nr:N-acetyltransferase [Bdellovibrionota bacterium]
MTDSDVEACADLVGRSELFRKYDFGADAATVLLRQALADPGSDLLVIRKQSGHSGPPQGFAWFIRRGAFQRSGYLRLIAISPDSRGAGAGKTLMTAIESKYLSDKGIFLLVTEENTAARRFYESLGYGFIGTIPDFVKRGLNECIYFKTG